MPSEGSFEDADDICRDPSAAQYCSGCLMHQIAVCTSMERAALEQIRGAAKLATFSKGKTIVEQGDKLDRVYFVRAGLIGLWRILEDGQRRVTGFLGPGDVLSGIKTREGAYCTAKAITAVRACYFERRDFLALLHEKSELGVVMLLTATDEIEAQNDHNILLGRKLLLERLAACLLMLAYRWTRPDEAGDGLVAPPISRTDIADYCGLTIESVSRGFTQLRVSGVISMPTRDRVILKNLPALHDLARFEEVPAGRAGFGL
jgi:CRP/FNR family transcriptional regulator, anaerobic regulatory protein